MLKDIPEGFKELVSIIIILIVTFFVVPYIGFIFRKATLIFFLFWITCPFIALSFRSKIFINLLTSRFYTNLRRILVVITIIISFCIFSNYDYIRDNIAKKYIDGYSVYYYEEKDVFGRSHISSDTSASLLGEIVLYLSQLIVMVACVGVPLFTWKIASVSIQYHEERCGKPKKTGG